MAINPVANGPLPLNHYITENLESNVSCLKKKSLALNVLEKISWVAFVAIVAVIFTVSYSGIVLTGNLPLLMVAMAISTPLFGLGASQFNLWSKNYSHQAKMEQGVLDKLNEISTWRTPQIQQFFAEQGLDFNQLPLQALREKKPNEPYLALLPLIARYMFLQELSQTTEQASKDKLNHLIERQIADGEIGRGKPMDEEQKRLIRLTNRQIAWRQHEHQAIPHALDAAIILQSLQNPTLDIAITQLGNYHAKSFEEREFDRRFAPRNDRYFVFHEEINRPPLTLAEIEQDMSPRALRTKLFPRAILA